MEVRSINPCSLYSQKPLKFRGDNNYASQNISNSPKTEIKEDTFIHMSHEFFRKTRSCGPFAQQTNLCNKRTSLAHRTIRNKHSLRVNKIHRSVLPKSKSDLEIGSWNYASQTELISYAQTSFVGYLC